MSAESGIAHPVAVGLEVFDGLVRLILYGPVLGPQSPQREHYYFDLAGIEFFYAGGQPLFPSQATYFVYDFGEIG